MPLDEQQVGKIQQLINKRNTLNLSVNNSFSKLSFMLDCHRDKPESCIDVCSEHRENIVQLHEELKQYDCQINELLTSLLKESWKK